MTLRKGRERGASAVEYGLLVAGIAAVIAIAVFAYGNTVKGKLFDTSCSTITTNIAPSAKCD